MSKLEAETWYRVGLVERNTKRGKAGGVRIEWREAYSLRADGGSMPWSTYREAQTMSRQAGKRAVFVKEQAK